jgi:hypothetical protein
MDPELERVNRELIDAREGFHRARELAAEAAQFIRDLRDPLNPDGLDAIRRSKLVLEQAWERYQTAIAAHGRYRARR